MFTANRHASTPVAKGLDSRNHMLTEKQKKENNKQGSFDALAQNDTKRTMSINRTPSSSILNPGRIMDSHIRNDSRDNKTPSEKSSKSLASNRSLFGKGQGAIFNKSNKAAIKSFREKLF